MTAGSNCRKGNWREEELLDGGLGDGWRFGGGCICRGLSGVWEVAEMSPPRLEDWTESWETRLGFIWCWLLWVRSEGPYGDLGERGWLRLLRGEVGSGTRVAVRFDVLRWWVYGTWSLGTGGGGGGW